MVSSDASASTSGLAQLFEAHRPQLLRFLKARGAADAADDLIQELWIRIATANHGPIAQPLSYLHRMAHNLLLDKRRAEARTARRNNDWHEVTTGIGADSAEEPSGERVLLAREELKLVQAEIDALGDRAATVFRRYRLEGESQRDIAQELGVSLSSVEKDLQRAYRVLLNMKRRQDAGI